LIGFLDLSEATLGTTFVSRERSLAAKMNDGAAILMMAFDHSRFNGWADPIVSTSFV
jgi:hypothetical protein